MCVWWQKSERDAAADTPLKKSKSGNASSETNKTI